MTIFRARREVVSAIRGTNDRLLVFVGPCSIHDPSAALEYCQKLKSLKEKYVEDLVIFMRCNIENPRTSASWKGLINDPDVDNTFKINTGIRTARNLFAGIVEQGMPIAAEIVDTLYTRFLGDMVSVGEVGPRATENELYRRLASGLDFPVAFRNGSDGTLGIAIDAINASKQSQTFLSLTLPGPVAIARSVGNEDCFIVLAGFYDAKSIGEVKQALDAANVRTQFMLDCGHGNSLDKYEEQLQFATSQISSGDTAIKGVVIKSYINEGEFIHCTKRQ
jgi:3-deoxy-7-phosphoheptulonate synthase